MQSVPLRLLVCRPGAIGTIPGWKHLVMVGQAVPITALRAGSRGIWPSAAAGAEGGAWLPDRALAGQGVAPSVQPGCFAFA